MCGRIEGKVNEEEVLEERIEGVVNKKIFLAIMFVSVSCNLVEDLTLVCEGLTFIFIRNIFPLIVGVICVIVSTLDYLGVGVMEHFKLLLKISANFSKALDFLSLNYSAGGDSAEYFSAYIKPCGTQMVVYFDEVDGTLTCFEKKITVSEMRSLPVIGM